jgi:chemotaxis protein methyltransferase CheR
MATVEPATPLLSDRDFLYTREDFRQIADIAYREAGIFMPESKEMLVYSRLGKRLRENGFTEFRSYCVLIASDAGAEERRKMISALTTNVTRFFREEHHFRHLADEVWPGLAKRLRSGGRARIWSAGCATGEEAYSIAMSLLKACPEAGKFDLRILATDVDPEVLEIARRGCYRADAIGTLPDWAREAYFKRPQPDGRAEVRESLRSLIDFRQLNLVRPLPMKGPFDVIFCRNVTIYFDADTQDRLWEAFTNVMAPGSQLYIGHSERLSPRLAPRFKVTGMTSYRLLPAPSAHTPRKG